MKTTAFTSLRQRLLRGGKSYGPLILSDSPVVAEVLGGMGYGHLIVDMEHSPTNLQSAQRLLQAMDAASAYCKDRPEPIIRLDSPQDSVKMKKILDSLRLPGGVLVPMVEDAETAHQVAQSTRYARQLDSSEQIEGIRGCAVPFVRASGWGLTSNENYLRQCQEDLLVMVQVESPKGVDAIPDICDVKGIDLIFLGPFDLSTAAGKMGQFDDPDVLSLIRRAERSILENNCLLGGFRAPGSTVREMFEKGYSLVCGAVDLGLLRESARLDAQEGVDAITAFSTTRGGNK